MSKKKSAPRPTCTEPSREQWEALCEVAGSLKRLAPWRALADTDILVLRFRGRSEPLYCSVMGPGYTGQKAEVLLQSRKNPVDKPIKRGMIRIIGISGADKDE